ncbi:MAG TPA: GAF domain-containing protein, partial [Anaerolineales bacterium]
AELAIINRVQEGLASKLEIRAIYELLGEKVREIFEADTTYINTYNPSEQSVYSQYYVDKGQRIIRGEPLPFGEGLYSRVIQTQQPIVLGTKEEQLKLGVTPASSPNSEQDLNQSYLGVPILLGDQVTGVVSVQSYQQNAYGDSDLRLLQTLANSMSVALENARLFDETQRLLKETEQRNAELAIINSVQQGLASKLEMQAIYDLVGNKIQDIFDSQSVLIITFDHASELTHIPYNFEKGQRYSSAPYSFTGFHRHLIHSGKTVLINEDAEKYQDEWGMVQLPGTERSKSMLFVPLISAGRVNGAISLQNIEHEHAFTEADVRLLETLANSMSIALESARLFDETQRLLKETEQRNAELEIINSVQQGLASKLEMQDIYDLVGDKLSEVTGSEVVVINTWDLGRETIRFDYIREKGERMGVIERPFTRLNKSVLPDLENGRTILWNNGVQERLKQFGHSLPAGEMPRSVLIVPLKIGQEFNTSISLQSISRENAFSDSDIRLIETLASSMSVALENARLFDETQRLLKETEQRAAELAIINSVQQGLVSRLDFQGIIDLVGDKILEIFDAHAINITEYDSRADLFSSLYTMERGIRRSFEPMKPGPLFRHVIDTHESLRFNTAKEFIDFGAITVPGTEFSLSGIYVPLFRGRQFMGVIALENLDHENAFTESDLRLLTTLANSMSVALENARLFDETQRLLKETEQRAAELAIINSVQQGLASKLDMQSIYTLVGDKIREIFRADTTYITMYNPEEEHVTSVYYVEKGQHTDIEPLPFGRGLYTPVIRSRQPVLANTHEEQAKLGAISIPSPDTEQDLNETFLGVPILIGGEAKGVVSIQSYQQFAYDENDVRLLQTLVNSMSVALENARLFKKEQQRAAELAAISKVSQALVAETELDNTIQLIGNQMGEIFEADIVYVALLDPETDLIHFPYQIGDTYDSLKLGEGLTSQIIQSGEPLLINKNIDERRRELGTTLIGKQSLSYLGVPIKAGKESIGVLSVQSTTQEGVFTEDDLRLLTTIAANAGAAIQTARLHAETQRRAQEMTTLAEIGNDIAASRELEPVLKRIASHAKEILRVRDIAIVLREPDRQAFQT